MNKETGKIEPELPIHDHRKIQYNENGKPIYSIEVFEDVGVAVCMALLDYCEDNPVS